MNCRENFQASYDELKLPCSEIGSGFFRNDCNFYPLTLPKTVKKLSTLILCFKLSFFFLSDHLEKPVARSVVELPLGYDIWNILDSECPAY